MLTAFTPPTPYTTPALFPHKKCLESFTPFNPYGLRSAALQPRLSDEREDGEVENKGRDVECLCAKSSAQKMKRKGGFFFVGEG